MNTEKAQLLEECKRIISERIAAAKASLQSYDQQAGEETKSSAGDKYETGRAMLHLEKEKISHQLNEALKLQQIINRIKMVPETSGLGKLIKTDNGSFFISAGLGQIKVAGVNYFAISLAAPLGKALANSMNGDEVTFNGRVYKILEVG